MAKAKSESPTFKYVGNESLPSVVDGVISEIQKHMMDEMKDSRRPTILPNMPKHFLCSEITVERETMMDIAGEDLEEDQRKKLHCYKMFIPFQINPYEVDIYSLTPPSAFTWSRNVISFCEISESNPEFVAIKIKGNLAKVKNYSTGEREIKYFPISDDKDQREALPSEPLKKFLKSSLVVEEPAGRCLISSYKLTISWLRSRLHKALNTYREISKNVEVIATIKQKTDGPLFLRLHVEEYDIFGKITEHDILFAVCPALRVTPCQLAVPVVSELDSIPSSFENKNVDKHCLWKIITKCGNTFPDHEHKTASMSVTRQLLDETATSQPKLPQINVEESKETADDITLYKESVNKCRPMTPSQCQQCEMCENPASRMLLEYYYQHGYIPEEEMSEAYSFIWEILAFLERSIEADRKPNDPKVLEFVQSGSVSEKLKVVQPDEFDVMIRIDLPRSTDGYTFVFDEMFPTGFAICRVKRSKSFSRGLKKCFRKSEEFGHCLAPEQLAFGWLYGKLERAINKYKNLEESSRKANLKLRRSGPALLLEITPVRPMPTLPRAISVDLVLALKLSKDDSRYAVAKRAKEEQFYKMVAMKMKSVDTSDQTNSNTKSPVEFEEGILNSASSSQNDINPSGILVQDENDAEDERAVDETMESARKNLKYLWRISYSAQEKQYLEYVREMQQNENVDGCQEICLMVLKTICTREILKQEESVICHKLSSYILKTALFHVLSKSDLTQDWKMDCLADRYVDLLDELSKWRDLPHFFFNNASSLRMVFPEDEWCNATVSKNLLSELHATLKIQLFDRFAQIAISFKKCKNAMDKKCEREEQAAEESLSYHASVSDVLKSGQKPEEVLHPPFYRRFSKPNEESRRLLIADEANDIRIGRAAKTERKSGPQSDASRNLRRSEAAKKANDEYKDFLHNIESFSGQRMWDFLVDFIEKYSDDFDDS